MRTANLAHPTAAGPAQALPLPLPILITAFCLLWASAFSVAKLAVGDCPPLLVLTARFLLAGVVMLGAGALYGVPFNLSRRDLVVFRPAWNSQPSGVPRPELCRHPQYLVRPRGAGHQR